MNIFIKFLLFQMKGSPSKTHFRLGMDVSMDTYEVRGGCSVNTDYVKVTFLSM